MKKLLLGLTLLTSISSFATASIHGEYNGLTQSGKSCSVVISSQFDNWIELDISLTKRLAGKRDYSFSLNEGVFYERIENGNSFTNIEENPWTDYYKIENLDLELKEDGTLKTYKVSVDRSGPFTINYKGSVECTDLVKK